MSSGSLYEKEESHRQFEQVVVPFHTVNGVPVSASYVTQEYVDSLASFPLEPSDVWVATFPKAGTAWIQQILKLIINRGEGDDTMIHHSMPWLEGNEHYKIDLNNLPKPRSFRSHFTYSTMPCGVPKLTPCKYIYVARNPKDVAVSLFFHYCRYYVLPGKILDWKLFLSNFLCGNVQFGDYFDHVVSWWVHKDDENVLFLKYEDMKRDLPAAVARIAKFIGHDLSDEIIAKVATKTSFNVMKNDDTVNFSWRPTRAGSTPFMRKGQVGDWKNHFTPEQSAEMDKICHERLEGTGLVFDFDL